MKILKIEFQNINSLKGRHEIDFSGAPFTTNSLFAITGPTGSGKSTILDVISLALFNQVPRLGKISRNEIINKGAILTRNQKEAWAKITYESRNRVFSSLWSISTNRNENLRDYEMHIFDLSTGKALDLKKSDVPAKNEELIGLSYDQFIKAVLLAQGEFAQFLKAKKDERGELLEKITGTGIYRQLGIKAYQKKKEEFSEIESQQQEIQVHRKNLLSDEEHQEFSKGLLEKSKSCEPFEKEIEKLKQYLQLKKDIKERIAQIEAHQQRKIEADGALERFEADHGLQLQRHDKIRLFGEELHSWKQLNENCTELQSKVVENYRDTQTNMKEISGCLEEIQKFIRKDAEAGTVEDQLQEFSAKVRKLQQQREEKGSTYKSLKREFDTEVREVPFQMNGNLETAEVKLREMQAHSKAQLEILDHHLSNIDLKDPVAEKQRLRKEMDKARKAEQQSVKLQNLAEELEKLRTEKNSISPQLEELPKKITLDKANAETLKERLEKLQIRKDHENLRRSLENHRHQLQDGQPCPLCGALDHPYAKDFPIQENDLQEEIRATEKELTEKQRKITGSETTLNHYRKQFEQLQQNAQKTERILIEQQSHFEAEFGTHEENFDWSRHISHVDRQIHSLDIYEQETRKLKAISAGLPLIKNLQTVLAEGLQLKAQLDEIYTGEDIHSDCLGLQKRWNSLQHQKTSLVKIAKDLENEVGSKKEQLELLEKGLLPKVQKEGCSQISEALELLIPEQKASELRKKKEALCNETTRTEAAIKTLILELKKLQERDIEADPRSLHEELQKKQRNLQDLNQACEELRRKLKNHNDTLQKIEKIEEGLVQKKQKIRRWELLNHLIGDSTGKKFNDFAQDLSLSQLLQLANIRLKDLSDRYRIDKPAEGEDDSLIVIDEHMGGQRRSVKTLSGGETFILSLSMALALSDLASKNVEINSLFIDEGFGTLDPETLDQTLDTLEKLQAEASKTIGIISHVDSLKERIATQVQLTRNGQGYSSLKVTG